MQDLQIRTIKNTDYHLLDDFLHNSIYQPQDAAPVPKEIIYTPEIYIYAKDFGSQKGDFGVVAEFENNVVGMAWTRIIPAYGHVNDETPELAISVLSQYRNKGIGEKLMFKLLEELKTNGFNQTSLSVQKDNPAVRFYLRLGYKIICERCDFADHEDYLMIKDLLNSRDAACHIQNRKE